MRKFLFLFVVSLFVSCDFLNEKYQNLKEPEFSKYYYCGHSYLRIKFFEYGSTFLHDPDCVCFNDSCLINWVMYEVHLNALGDDRYKKYQLGNNFVFHLPDSDSVCELIKNLPDNILVSLREYDFDSVSDILYKLTEQ